MQRRIEFTATGSSALVGNFSAGDVWRGPEDHCTHLVEVHGCAKWADQADQAVADIITKQEQQLAEEAAEAAPSAVAADAVEQPEQAAAEVAAELGEQAPNASDIEQTAQATTEVVAEATEQPAADPAQDAADKPATGKKKGAQA